MCRTGEHGDVPYVLYLEDFLFNVNQLIMNPVPTDAPHMCALLVHLLASTLALGRLIAPLPFASVLGAGWLIG